MTLDEAIQHAEDIADSLGCTECASDHRQLATWLRDYKKLISNGGDAMKIIVDKLPEFFHKCDFCRVNAPGFNGPICTLTAQYISINGNPEIGFSLCPMCEGGKCNKLKSIREAMSEVLLHE